MERRTITSGTEWESTVGYARAVVADGRVHVSGTTATDDTGAIVGEDDPYEQTRRALENVASALEQAGASLEDVVRTRMFVTDIDDWEAIGRAHEECFGEIRPATSMLEVGRLVDPAMVVEIEAEAVVSEGE
ncbi:RidA family protein [Halobacteria archaeon AArc-m2/3/4]|uniref:RidA family protein n=1 Tax=Natronoglomus mannanivorans TaxID=2979990 RepID=A0AAP3E0U0_9EURY|nr:RidA family protein [Halobacteria archaeon AArc-xg1-1]MCU4972573.1 RidA family protein [Halobacteria archaeon AArc-m2/3/4]